MASGCVLSDPPEYGTVKQTPPFLQLDGAKPSIYKVTKLDTSIPGQANQTITVDVRSEDAGDELIAILFIDYDPSNTNKDGSPDFSEQGSRTLAPSTLEDSRTVSVPWNAQGRQGCHQVTMVVTHKGNLDPAANQPLDSTDAAYATWWFNIDDDPLDKSNVEDCGPESTVTN